jgi:hypothetical protein
METLTKAQSKTLYADYLECYKIEVELRDSARRHGRKNDYVQAIASLLKGAQLEGLSRELAMQAWTEALKAYK